MASYYRILKIILCKPKKIVSSINRRIIQTYIHIVLPQEDSFDAEYYLRTYPDVARKKIDPWFHFVSYGRAEGRRRSSTWNNIIGETKSFLPLVKSNLEHLRQFDVFLNSISETQLRDIEVGIPHIASAAAVEIAQISDLLTINFKNLVVVGTVKIGGAERYACNVLQAMIEENGIDSTLLVVTEDSNIEAPHWLPTGLQTLYLSNTLSRVERQEVITKLISLMCPRITLNINSLALWDGLEQMAVALKRFTKLYVAIFCYDYSEDNTIGGYAVNPFPAIAHHLSGVIFDNASFIEKIIDDFGFPRSFRDRFHVMLTPVKLETKEYTAVSVRRPKILWASRLSRQKQPALALQIAALCPQCDFHFYGEGAAKITDEIKNTMLPNVTLKPFFREPDDIIDKNYAAFLYTSLWDGMPQILLEMASRSIPIVASGVGGISELVTSDTGWRVDAVTDPKAYAEALMDVIENASAVQEKRKAMKRLLKDQHTWDRFKQSLKLAGIIEDEKSDVIL